ncbi:retrovirus-related pol polyprotein from transposon TNT 1-94 [Tanacetum coccineum]
MILSKTNQLMLKTLEVQAELDKYNDVNYASKVEIDCAKAKGDLMALVHIKITISIMAQAKEAQIKLYKTREDKELDKVTALENKVKVLNDIVYKTGQSVQTINMLNRNCKTSFAKLEFLKKAQRANPRMYDIVERCKQTIAKRTYFGNIDPFIQNTIEGNFGPQISRLNADLEKFHLCLNEEMVADLRYFNSLEHEVDTLKSQLETQKTQFLNEIDRLSREYYYADHMNAILGVYTDLDEFTNLQCDYVETWEKCEHLEKELSKSRTMSKSFEALQKHAINLELDLQQCKEKIKNDKSFKENQSNVFLKEREQYFEIQDLKAQLQDKGIAISELKKLIEKMKGKSVETKFEKSSVIRQPNAFKSQRQSILGKPAIFSDSLAKKDFSKSKPVTTQNVSNDFSKTVTAQILPQNMLPIVKNTNVIAPGMYKVHTKPTQTRTPQLHQDIRKPNKRVSFSTGVIPNTSVSRPQLKSNHLEDRVMSNNSQGKKQEVEDHRRKFKFSNNKTSVTACNDSLNAKTSNVNFVCVTCGKCVLNDNHDLCVLHYINGVNSRTRQPMAVPVSTREPKHNVNQSVATFSKKTVATDSTLVEIILFIVDSGCSKHMTGNLKLLTNFVEKFLGTVKFGNDQIAPILGYGDLVQGTITIKRVYYVEGLNHNLFSVGQFCDADLEVAFRKSTCYIRDLKGNDLLTGSRGTDLYSISLQDSTTPNPICLMAKATSSQAWLWHRRLSHLNFDTINLLSKNNIVNGLPKLKFIKDHLRNRTLVEAARTMLSAAKVPLFFWAEAIATACFTQNRSLVIPRHEKTPYHIITMPETVSQISFTSLVLFCYSVEMSENLDERKKNGYAQKKELIRRVISAPVARLEAVTAVPCHGMDPSCDRIGTPMATKHLDADCVTPIKWVSGIEGDRFRTLTAFSDSDSWAVSIHDKRHLVAYNFRWCLDDGVAASFQRSRIHKPHAHTQAFKWDNKEDEDDEDEEEEEHLAPVDSAIIVPTVELDSISLPPEAEVERLLAMPTPPPSPPISLSPPSARERLARDDIPEFEQPPRKRLCLSTLSSRYEIEESSTARPTGGRGVDYGFVSIVDAKSRWQGISEVGYRIRDTWVDLAEAVPKIAPMIVEEVNTRVTDLDELHERDTQDLYALLEDAQDGRTRISQRFAMDSLRVDLLMGDRMTL